MEERGGRIGEGEIDRSNGWRVDGRGVVDEGEVERMRDGGVVEQWMRREGGGRWEGGRRWRTSEAAPAHDQEVLLSRFFSVCVSVCLCALV